MTNPATKSRSPKKYDALDKTQGSTQSDFTTLKALQEYEAGEFLTREEILAARKVKK